MAQTGPTGRDQSSVWGGRISIRVYVLKVQRIENNPISRTEYFISHICIHDKGQINKFTYRRVAVHPRCSLQKGTSKNYDILKVVVDVQYDNIN